MTITVSHPSRGLIFGAAAALILLTAVNRPARAAKATECLNQSSAVCQVVERCSGGFEQNGSCKWIYTVNRYYWKY
jgi:hypothetical protein